ncbi:MAG: citrate synthase [Clostridiales bacterium]|nr:citrate synthase [Clostridiales bacterium]
MHSYISPISNESLSILCKSLMDNNHIDQDDFEFYNVKRGLRNQDGSGVMAGLTRICSVDGYYIADGEKQPKEGRLIYRGINVEEIVEDCVKNDRFGFEEVVWLLLFGSLPTKERLDHFCETLSKCRELPANFVEDVIMKLPSPNIMNKLAHSVLALYPYDETPDDNSIPNVLRQSIQLVAQIPIIMSYAYQVKRKNYYHESMYIHQVKPEHRTAEVILRAIRSKKQFTDKEAKLLDRCLILHAEHGGGNNSTFATRVLTSAETDTYSAISAGIGSLKGHKHGGANLKVAEMVEDIKEHVSDITDPGQVADYITKIVKKEAGDRSGLVYGMGHAVYTYSDPRAVILKEEAKKYLPEAPEFEDELRLLELIEELTPEIFKKLKGSNKVICANVDLYSGLVYKMLRIPKDLFTPLFTVARLPGWCAHRIEEIITGGRIIRPAYKSLFESMDYIPLNERQEDIVVKAKKHGPKSNSFLYL